MWFDDTTLVCGGADIDLVEANKSIHSQLALRLRYLMSAGKGISWIKLSKFPVL